MDNSQMYNWRVHALNQALAKIGKETGPLLVSDLTQLGHLDQYHYLGTDSCDEVIEMLGLDESCRVLDIGSGIGGPVRYLYTKTGGQYVGVDVQADLVEKAQELVQRCGMQEQVKYLAGDFIALANTDQAGLLGAGSFTHFISMLVFLHVPDRSQMLRSAHTALAPGGAFLIEDYVALDDHGRITSTSNSVTTEERTLLQEVVHANSVTTVAQYKSDLEAAGFVDVQFENITPKWKPWIKARCDKYADNKAAAVAMHGETVFTDRSYFYSIVKKLFMGGHVGGVRITGRKRGVHEERLYRGRLSTSSHDETDETGSKAKLNEFSSEAD